MSESKCATAGSWMLDGRRLAHGGEQRVVGGSARVGPRPAMRPPFCRRLFSRPGEVTAAPGKPIAPSGEPGDKFMPLLNLQSQMREL